MKQILLFLVLSFSFSCTSKFYVAPKMADCVLPGKSSCYLIKSSLEENWLMIPEEIYDFEYEEGFIYRIKVKNIKVKDDFNNTISAYRFLEVLSKEQFTGKKISENVLDVKKHKVAVALNTDESYLSLHIVP